MPSDLVTTLTAQDGASATAWSWAEKTFGARRGRGGRIIPPNVAQFSSWIDLGQCRVAITSDGIGTKIEVAERVGRFDTLGFDLLAMVVDDLAANGAEPIALTNILDVDRIDQRTIDQLMGGLHNACLEASVSIAGGEIAELGGRVGGHGLGMHFNWSATAIGGLREGWEPVDGTKLTPGDEVIAVESTSFRSNGYTAARRALTAAFGTSWHEASFEGRTYGEWLLDPCRAYAPLVVALRAEGVEARGFAHITGGGLPGKLGRTLRAGHRGAVLTNLFSPSSAMEQVRTLGAISLADAYRHWNMGNGFILVVPPSETDRTLELCARMSFPAKRAGLIVEHEVLELRVGGQRLEYSLR
ncbi:MAG: phosphoribosylformylglycinamidine cyclo-ligase [Deltaproteobacteria bacterium]|nr:phosphoribosylformylglycinamidine cyclo-ligase [Deltaproteobacteria bacterium]